MKRMNCKDCKHFILLTALMLTIAMLLHPLIYLSAKDHQKRWHIEQCISFDETTEKAKEQYFRIVEELMKEAKVHCLMAGLETKE